MNRLQNTVGIIQELPKIIEADVGLYPSQKSVLNQYISDPKNHQTGVFALATGFGKTRMMSAILLAYKNYIDSLILNDKNVTFQGKGILVVPTTTLIRDDAGNGLDKKLQDYNKMFCNEPLDIGLYYTDKKDYQNQFIITTYNSLAKLLDKIDPAQVGLLLLDEAHHGISNARIKAIKRCKNAAQYGMTATPSYSPDRSVIHVLDKVIAEVDVVQSIQERNLCEVKNVLMISDVKVDLTSVKLSASGEYNEEDYNEAILRAMQGRKRADEENNWRMVHHYIAKGVAEFYQNYVDEFAGSINGKKCLINCRSQEEARIQAYELNKFFGRHVADIWTTNYSKRNTLNSFINGDLLILCQVGRLSEGFDMPELEVVFNYPTASHILEAQRSGRVLRKFVDGRQKIGLVIDIAFQHPEYDNILDAIHKNKQVLYQDILQRPFVLLDDKKTKKHLHAYRSRQTLDEIAFEPIVLDGFKVLSDSASLLAIKQDRDLLEQYRADCWTKERLVDKYHLGQYRASLLNNLFQKYLTHVFVDDKTHKKIPFVIKLKSRGKSIEYAFVNHPYILKTIENENKSFLCSHSEATPRLSWKNIARLYGIRYQSVQKLFKGYLFRSYQNPETGEVLPFFKIVGSSKMLTDDLVAHQIFINENIDDIIRERAYLKTLMETSNNDNETLEGIDPLFYSQIIQMIENAKNNKGKFLTKTSEMLPQVIRSVSNEKDSIIDASQPKEETVVEPPKKNFLTIKEVATLYGIQRSAAQKFLENYQGRTYRDPQTGQRFSFVVKLENDQLVMSNDPEAHRKFIFENKPEIIRERALLKRISEHKSHSKE